jgi:site-specific recombinase XerD
MYPEKKELAEKIINIPQKRTQKQLIGFLYPDEILKALQSVDLKKSDGFRDYTILHLLNDSGARASEVATLNIDYFNPHKKTLAILGKGNRYRLIELCPKTTQLIELYISKYRTTPKPLYQNTLFINQRAKQFTRHGIYRICKKYLSTALDPKRLKEINPVHSFRHSCAMRILYKDKDLSKIQHRLGHENIQTTTLYTHFDINHKRQLQKQFDEYTQSVLTHDPKIEKLIDWENKEDIMDWLDSL